MIEILLFQSIYLSSALKQSRYFFDPLYLHQYFLPITFLICFGIFIILMIIIALLLREFMRESTERCPYCQKRIPTDAAWCKFCKRDLTEDLVSDRGISASGGKEKQCPKCDRDMRYIEEYDRWYCPECWEYR